MSAEWWQAVGVVVAVVGINKIMLGSAVKSIKEHCNTQRAACKETHDNLWERVNKHGHKSLTGNGAKVTI